jgi:hypothetical protein
MSDVPVAGTERTHSAITPEPICAIRMSDDLLQHVTDADSLWLGCRVRELEEEKTFLRMNWPILALAAGLVAVLPFVFLYLLTLPNMVEAAVVVAAALGMLVFGLGFYTGMEYRDYDEG